MFENEQVEIYSFTLLIVKTNLPHHSFYPSNLGIKAMAEGFGTLKGTRTCHLRTTVIYALKFEATN